MAINIDYRLHGVFTVGRFLNRHPPRFIVAVHAAADQRATNRHQIAGDPFLLHQARQMIGGIALADGGKIDK